MKNRQREPAATIAAGRTFLSDLNNIKYHGRASCRLGALVTLVLSIAGMNGFYSKGSKA